MREGSERERLLRLRLFLLWDGSAVGDAAKKSKKSFYWLAGGFRGVTPRGREIEGKRGRDQQKGCFVFFVCTSIEEERFSE